MNALSAAPSISVKPVVGGVQISVRYITRASERAELRAKLNHAAVDLLAADVVPHPESEPKPSSDSTNGALNAAKHGDDKHGGDKQDPATTPRPVLNTR